MIKAGRGGTRIFLEGLWLLRSGFEAFGEATVLLDEDRRRVTLLLDPDLAQALSSGASTRTIQKKISGKVKRGKKVPVIDIERQDLTRVLGGARELVVQSRHGQLVITPSQAEALRNERLAAPPNNWEVGLYSGAGFLSLAAEQAGARSVLAIEQWDKAADVLWSARQVPVLQAGVEDVALAEVQAAGTFDLPRNPWVLTAGVPCEAYSRKGGRGVTARDPHDLADQIYWTLVLILRINPQNVVVENVPEFLKYAGGFVRALQVLGYHVHVAELDPSEHGYAAGRRRAVIVATTQPGFQFPAPRRTKLRGQRVRDLLFPPEDPRLYERPIRQGGWFSVQEGKRKHEAWERARRPLKGGRIPPKYSGLDQQLYNWLHGRDSKGRKRKGHPPTVVEYRDACVPAVTKSMYKTDPQGPYVHHPKKLDLYRLLTLEEIEQLHGVPDEYADRVEEAAGRYALATQFYGQGVHVPLFRRVFERLPGGRRGPRTVSVNPARVAPLWYGAGPLYSVLPWRAIQ